MAKVIDENYIMVKGVKQPINPPIDAKRGDYFKDSNGQIWIKQDYGGWASHNRGGTGNDLTNAERATNGGEFVELDNAMKQAGVKARIKPPVGPGTKLDQTTQYPANGTIGEHSDYVLFEFKKYNPPFQKRTQKAFDAAGSRWSANFTGFDTKGLNLNTEEKLGQYLGQEIDYNQSGQYEDAGKGFEPIVMYMPEDISTGFRGNWGGKAFSTTGAGILTAAGEQGLKNKFGGGFGVISGSAERALGLASAKIIQKAVKKAGGDQLSNNDIFGSISGAILNPNTELLYQSVDMRNFMLKFKLVPRNQDDSDAINKIVRTFKACTLPHRDPGQVMGFNDPGKELNKGVVAGFIGIPNLCKVSFMRGAKESEILPRYKMLAVTQVDVNYTPDGAYATYNDTKAQPVAIELSINFQETKINFAEEVLSNAIR